MDSVVKKPRTQLQSIVDPASLPKPLNREETCPILIRMFYSTSGRYHSLSEFSKSRFPKSEMAINTWFDASIKELANHIRTECSEARKKGALLEFSIVFSDTNRSTYRRKELGTFINNRGPNPDSEITLKMKSFTIGDYIDVAVHPDGPNRINDRSRDRSRDTRRVGLNRPAFGRRLGRRNNF